MTAISQMQISYSPEEDRILFRVNTDTRDEFRFWLTRRFTMILAQALRAHREADPDLATQPTEDARQAVQSFKQEAAQAQGNFNEEFKQSSSYPLGEQPVLAFKLSYRVEGGNLHLSLQPKNGQGISLVLTPELNFNVSKLLRSASEQAEWQLNWQQEEPEAAPSHVVN